ncbi:MAG: hypothetical protein K2H47_09650 [Muribaculaceae bacterium]|nr:hypothetical protein [Muribaculaceae bacterium]
MPNTRIVKIGFEEYIAPRDLSRFRGVMIRLSGDNELFHNHQGVTGYHYSYPKIQYKIIDGCAAVVGINEGAEALLQMFSGGGCILCQFGYKEVTLHVASVEESNYEMALTKDFHKYRIDDWLPLNSRNYEQFSNADGLISQIALLEKILTGNILSTAKGLGVYFDSRVICRIDSLDYDGPTMYKGVELMNFTASFRTNVILPQWIGLGKSSSLNHGTITYINKNQ